MLLENYTGDSKVLKAIAHILNRKAPLPLDGDGDAEWGTNGQVLTTDGSGATSWTTPSGGGDSVEWTQIQASGTKIAKIDINGTSTDVYAPNGGGGGGGHTIWNRIKTALTARSNLWFADAKISDASADDATKVEVLTELADETAFDNLPTDGTADGMYAFPDSGAKYLDASMVGYGAGTVADALTWALIKQFANGDSATIDLTQYRELLIIPMVMGAIPYSPIIMSASVLNTAGRMYHSIYQDGTYHSNFSFYLSTNTMTLSVANVSGWGTLEVIVYAR